MKLKHAILIAAHWALKRARAAGRVAMVMHAMDV